MGSANVSRSPRRWPPGPRCWVLHHPTTAVDAATESCIAQRLPERRRDHTTTTTTTTVTTSPALLSAADRVVPVAAGRAAAVGTHEVLVATEPAYRAAVLS